jgi:protocatechuate 3,4-dioxygenase beta subunit
MHDDDATVGRVLARRDVLALLGTGAGAAVLASSFPEVLARTGRGAVRLAPGTAHAGSTLPTCIVRPAQIEGPYFVDEKLLRSDIRSDPSDGSIREGTALRLTFNVSRLDAAICSVFPGVLVDVWHCDAAGVYSDVVDPSFDTRGKKYLRGYQVTDAGGVATFVTVYPGWYAGRTVHVHVKLRTDPEATSALEFTSQVYFDDALTDEVFAQQPYASRGERTVRNAGDGIFQAGGSQLLFAVVPDGAGGYAATFDVALQMAGVEACTTPSSCVTQLRAALPTPATADDARSRRTARRLQRRTNKLAALLERAAGASGASQAKKYAKARTRLEALLAATQQASAAGTLGAALGPIEAAIAALMAQLPV